MAASDTTLASLWVDDASGSPIRTIPVTPSKSSNGMELKEEVHHFYKTSGLETVAKEAGILDQNGELAGYTTISAQGHKGIQMIALPIQQSPAKSPLQATVIPRQQQSILHTPTQRLVTSQVLTTTPRGAQVVSVVQDSPIHTWGSAGSIGRKRSVDVMEAADYGDISRSAAKTTSRGHKGLRHFSTKVCEKVQEKGVTTYGEVADELVRELNDPYFCQYDQKNIRRRVYDALNVLMAMNIISKEKKEIKWIGLPTNSAQEVHNLELEKKRRMERIKHKTQQLQELILQQIAFKNLVTRNQEHERENGPPTSNSAIQLPYIIVNTSKKTVIDCSISNDKYEYLFNFDNTFEIHDDIEVLKRMGMAFGLEKNQCKAEDIRKAVKMVPKALEPYVLELAHQKGEPLSASTSGINTGLPSLAEQSMDAEVAAATRGLSRQSSVTSHSYSRETPADDTFSDSASERSTPVDIT